jgi:hypothetical protein
MSGIQKRSNDKTNGQYIARSLKAEQLIPLFTTANAGGSLSCRFLYDVMPKKGSR